MTASPDLPPDPISLVFPPGSVKGQELVAAAAKKLLTLSPAQIVRGMQSRDFWDTVAGNVVHLVRSLTDIPLADILVGGWKTHNQFTKYRDKTKYPPDRLVIVPLKTHHITSTHKPYLELFVNDQYAGRIDFTITLDVAIEAGNLVIQDAKFKRIEAARVRVTGTLACEGQVVVERSSRDFVWKEGVAFGEGIPIEVVA